MYTVAQLLIHVVALSLRAIHPRPPCAPPTPRRDPGTCRRAANWRTTRLPRRSRLREAIAVRLARPDGMMRGAARAPLDLAIVSRIRATMGRVDVLNSQWRGVKTPRKPGRERDGEGGGRKGRGTDRRGSSWAGLGKGAAFRARARRASTAASRPLPSGCLIRPLCSSLLCVGWRIRASAPGQKFRTPAQGRPQNEQVTCHLRTLAFPSLRAG